MFVVQQDNRVVVAVLFISLIFVISQTKGEDEKTSGTTLPILLNNHLSDCTPLLISILDQSNNFYQQSLKELIFGIIRRSLNPFLNHNQMYIENQKYYNVSSSNILISPLKTLRRPLGQRGSNCVTAVLLIFTIKEHTLVNLAKIMIPVLQPVIHKDKEKFLAFTTEQLVVESFLKSPNMGKKLKYKIVAVFEKDSPEENRLTIYSACEFCNKQEIFKLNDPTTPNLFLDYQVNFHCHLIQISTSEGTRGRLNYTLVNGKYIPTNGMLAVVLEYFKLKLNFTFELRPTPGGTGMKLPNGSYDGVVGDIVNGNAQIGMSTAETYERTQIIGFTSAIVYETLTLVSGPPKKFYSWIAIFWPLDVNVWAATGVVTFVSVGLIASVYDILLAQNKARRIWELGRIFEYIAGAFVGQSNQLPVYMPITVQIYLCVWLLGSFVLVTAYLSKLVDFLTFPVVETIPSTIEELAKSKFDWGLAYFGGVAYTLIKSSKIPAFIEISKRLELIKIHEKCLTKAIHSNFICISYDSLAKHYIYAQFSDNYGNTPLVISPNGFSSFPVGIACEKRTVFGPNFEKAIDAFTTMGLAIQWEIWDYEKLKVKHSFKNEIENVGANASFQNQREKIMLTMKHLRGATVVFSAGAAAAFIVFVIEILYHC